MKWRFFAIGFVSIPLLIFQSACLAQSTPLTPTHSPTVVALTRYISQTPTPAQTGTPIATQTIPTITPTLQVYLVAANELGSEIALRYGITVAMLKAANPDVDLDFLKEGQQLIIPGISATQVPLAFTPTPMQLNIQAPHCYPSDDSGAWCLVQIQNNQSEPIYYLSGDFYFESEGQIRIANSTALVDVLPVGAQVPLIARFEPPVGYPFQVRFQLNSAFTAENPVVWPLEMKDTKIEIDPSGLVGNLSGQVLKNDQNLKQIAVIGVAYNGSRPVGIRRIEIGIDQTSDQDQRFEMTLFTTGLPIDSIELFAEGS